MRRFSPLGGNTSCWGQILRHSLRMTSRGGLKEYLQTRIAPVLHRTLQKPLIGRGDCGYDMCFRENVLPRRWQGVWPQDIVVAFLKVLSMQHQVIDFHTHAFPDDLAPSAMRTLLAEAPGIRAHLDGTVGALLGSMDDAGIAQSVICCIATKPQQFDPIVRWCDSIRSTRLIPLPSVHPNDPEIVEHIGLIKARGFLGVKMHPYYQDFYVGDDRMSPFYEEVSRQGLLLVMHTGFDIAFPRDRRADPETLLRISEAFPQLKLVTTHLGGWQQWDEVRRHLLGRPIYMEISFAMQDLSLSVVREMLMNHPEEYLLFGTDSPWTGPKETLQLLEGLELPPSRLDRMLWRNAADLLGQASDSPDSGY